MDKLFGWARGSHRSRGMGSSIGQSILMAITVTVNKYASSNVQPVSYKKTSPTGKNRGSESGSRRGLVLAAVIAQASDSQSQLLSSKALMETLLLKTLSFWDWNPTAVVHAEFLKKSEENKVKNDKEVQPVTPNEVFHISPFDVKTRNTSTVFELIIVKCISTFWHNLYISQNDVILTRWKWLLATLNELQFLSWLFEESYFVRNDMDVYELECRGWIVTIRGTTRTTSSLWKGRWKGRARNSWRNRRRVSGLGLKLISSSFCSRAGRWL